MGQNIDFDSVQVMDAPPETAPASVETETPGIVSDSDLQEFTGLSVSPGKKASAATSGSVAPVEPNSIFDLAANAFEERVDSLPKPNQAGSVTAKPAPGTESKKVSEIIPEGMIELSADMYVEILEMVIQTICQMFGDEQGKYLFDKVYKEKYKEITAKFFKYQNVMITPGQLFAFATIALIGGVGIKAFKDRKNRLRVEQFQKKAAAKSAGTPAGKQIAMEMPGMEVVKSIRKRYDLDDENRYSRKENGEYAKQNERENAPAELVPFLREMFSKNATWPDAKQVNAYLNN